MQTNIVLNTTNVIMFDKILQDYLRSKSLLFTNTVSLFPVIGQLIKVSVDNGHR